MSTTAFEQQSASSLLSLESTSVEHVDSLAREFLEREKKASDAYDAAYMLDTSHEHAKIKLISLLWDSALQQDDWRILRGSQYEARLKLVRSCCFNNDAVREFRNALIRQLRPQGMLTDIFTGNISYTFTENADKIIEKLNLSDSLTELYRKCRPAIETPILEVQHIQL